MAKTIAIALILPLTMATAQADTVAGPTSGFWSSLDRNGPLSAGWVQVLPVLASACSLRLDSRELNDRLVDLSRRNGNTSYTRDLYYTLYQIEDHHASNRFVAAWTAHFSGKQKQACETAEALWGNTGSQFPGVLKRDASNDSTATIPPNAQPNCH
jgi:hypothetical protein